jgi:hypothetical protein
VRHTFNIIYCFECCWLLATSGWWDRALSLTNLLNDDRNSKAAGGEQLAAGGIVL